MYNTMYHTTTATEEETQYVTETKKMPPKTITTTESAPGGFQPFAHPFSWMSTDICIS